MDTEPITLQWLIDIGFALTHQQDDEWTCCVQGRVCLYVSSNGDVCIANEDTRSISAESVSIPALCNTRGDLRLLMAALRIPTVGGDAGVVRSETNGGDKAYAAKVVFGGANEPISHWYVCEKCNHTFNHDRDTALSCPACGVDYVRKMREGERDGADEPTITPTQ